MLQSLLKKFLYLFQRGRFDRELDEEMQFHLAMKTRENLEAGMSPEESRYLREVLILVLIGVAMGVPAALAGTQVISSFLFGLTPIDPTTIAIAAELMVAVAALAGYPPARRASRFDPVIALRYE
jgi:ABC-type lipoprotein release transport system permease subunit